MMKWWWKIGHWRHPTSIFSGIFCRPLPCLVEWLRLEVGCMLQWFMVAGKRGIGMEHKRQFRYVIISNLFHCSLYRDSDHWFVLHTVFHSISVPFPHIFYMSFCCLTFWPLRRFGQYEWHSSLLRGWHIGLWAFRSGSKDGISAASVCWRGLSLLYWRLG